jgi:outer membrane receptor protein involved in Fe transport
VKKTQYSKLKLGAAPLVLGVALVSAPAYAQDEGATSSSEIVVTGTLIRNPNLEQAMPVSVIGADAMELRQASVAEELLRELPGVTPSIGSAVNNGNGGASFVNLRNMGSNRNVVLLDGVRIVPAELGGRFDLNNVPLALIERVDVLTGGASTTYGADAVAGVVNFITRKNFAGVEANLSTGITERGDGHSFRADVTIGANFDDGRGNAVLSIGYQESDAVYQGSRPWGEVAIFSDDGGAGGSGTSVPTRFSLPGLGSPQLNPDGQSFNIGGGIIPYNYNPLNVYQTPFQRFNMYAAANYEVSDSVEVYTRGIFSKQTVSTIIAPSGAFGLPVNLPLNNPFLSDSVRNSFCAANGISAAACALAANASDPSVPARIPDPDDPEATIANPAYRPGYQTVRTAISRRAVEVGPRISDYDTTLFDYRLGFRGDLSSSLSWDVFGSYGQSENIQTIQGYTLNSRVQDSLMANTTDSCFSGTAAGCVPVDWFGPTGNATWTPEAIDFLSDNSTVRTKVSMAQVRGTLSGDVGFTSPLGSEPIAFAVGGEYRRYTASQQSDTLAAAGDLGGSGGAAPNISGGYDVYEAFGELIVPLIQDKPFFEDLTIEGGIRYSSYTVDTAGKPGFNTTTWKVGGSWTPVRDIKFRGNYARAVRAPNIEELFSPINTNLTNLADDPCASRDGNFNVIRDVPTGTLREVCLAQGATAATVDTIMVPTSGQANYTGGGNPALKPEVGTTWTVGAVIEPSFIPRLALTVDYYNIKITKAISAPVPGDAITACFGDPTGTNAYNRPTYTPAAGAAQSEACTSIDRSDSAGALSGEYSETKGLPLYSSNLGKIKASGIDVSLNYAHDIGFADLRFSGMLNWTEKSVFQSNPMSVPLDCVGYYSADCGQPIPEWNWSLRTTLAFDAVDVSVLWRHIGGTKYDGTGMFAGTLDEDVGTLAGKQVDFGRIKAHDYFDLTTRWSIGDTVTLVLAVNNLFDKKPPLVGGEAGSTAYNSGNTFPSTYDALGRRYTVSARLRF